MLRPAVALHGRKEVAAASSSGVMLELRQSGEGSRCLNSQAPPECWERGPGTTLDEEMELK